MIIKTKYTQIWNEGDTLSVNCKVNTETKEVFDIELDCIKFSGVLNAEYVKIDSQMHFVFPEEAKPSNSYWHK